MNLNAQITTTAQLRQALAMINMLMIDVWTGEPVYCLVPTSEFEALCPDGLGDTTLTMKEQFYEVARDANNVCVKTANVNYHTIDGERVPNGNYTEKCFTEEVFKAWVAHFGVDAFYMENPIEVVSEDVI